MEVKGERKLENEKKGPKGVIMVRDVLGKNNYVRNSTKISTISDKIQ